MAKQVTMTGSDLKFIWTTAKKVLDLRDWKDYSDIISLEFAGGHCQVYLAESTMLADFQVDCTGDDFEVLVPYVELPLKWLKGEGTISYDEDLEKLTLNYSGQQITIGVSDANYIDVQRVMPQAMPSLKMKFTRRLLIKALQSMPDECVFINIYGEPKPLMETPIILQGVDTMGLRLVQPCRHSKIEGV